MKKSNKIQDVIGIAIIIALLWIFISSSVQRFKCTDMTETQLFLHIPKAFICDWECPEKK